MSFELDLEEHLEVLPHLERSTIQKHFQKRQSQVKSATPQRLTGKKPARWHDIAEGL